MRTLLRPFWLALAGAAGPVGVIVLPAAVLVLLGVILMLLASSARAHDPYEGVSLYRQGMASPIDCCKGKDCAPYPHRSTEGELGFEALINGRWIPLPLDKLATYSWDGQVHVCCIGGQCERHAEPERAIRCVIVPGSAS